VIGGLIDKRCYGRDGLIALSRSASLRFTALLYARLRVHANDWPYCVNRGDAVHRGPAPGIVTVIVRLVERSRGSVSIQSWYSRHGVEGGARSYYRWT